MPVGTGVYDPNPNLIWRIDESIPGRVIAAANIFYRLTITPAFGDLINLTQAGTVTAQGFTKVDGNQQPELKPIYGNRPAGFSVFLRLRPKGNMADHMRQMHGH